MADEKIIVQLNAPKDRLFVKAYHDFLDNNFLTAEEQMIFIALKSFIDFKKDSGETFPSMRTICKRAKMSEKRARKNINALIKKGIVKKVQRGLTKTNLYEIADFPAMWAATSEQEIKQAIEQERAAMDLQKYSDEELLKEMERRKKEKGLVSDTDQSTETSTYQNHFTTDKNTIDQPKSQAERYTMTNIKELYEYDSLIIQYPNKLTDIDIVFEILYETMNSTKKTIRISGEDKPQMVVIGKLMKLQPDNLIYSIDRYHEQTERIKNVKGYLLTILFNSREQNYLDLMNLGHHNGDF